ncbi:MAG: PEP-CTERM sorting domain-containing protein [Tepidisphaeraceae bacterium]|jgi:type II secretory pathway component PulM
MPFGVELVRNGLEGLPFRPSLTHHRQQIGNGGQQLRQVTLWVDATAGDVAALDAFAAANGITLADVPEPASAVTIVMAGLGILRRRRRK